MAKYSITPENKILADGEEIGHFDENDQIVLNEGEEQLSTQAQGYLKRSRAGSAEEQPEQTQEEIEQEIEEEVGEKPPEKKAAPKSNLPPAPKQDPRMGDKTPAYVQWLAKNKPEEFKRVYAGRKVMGVQLPSEIKEIPEFPASNVPPVGGDVPESSMAKEAPEQWMKR